MPESQLRLLVACGAAGGISATFNAPIAGVFFSLELILRSFQAQSFGLIVLSSVTAAAIGRAAFGNHHFLSLPAFNFSSPLELLLYAGLGILACGVGLAFIRVLYERRGSRRPAVARAGVAAAGGGRDPARAAAAGRAADVRGRLPGAASTRSPATT